MENAILGSTYIRRNLQFSLDEVLFRLRARNPQMDQEELYEAFSDEVESDKEAYEALKRYFFTNKIRMVQQIADSKSRPALEPERTVGKRAPGGGPTAYTREKIENVKAQILLLALPMPNGKPMRDCTQLEMRSFGDGYKRIADRMGKAQKVGEALSENQVREILAKTK